MAQQCALWGSHTAGHGEVWADGRLEMEPRKERPRKMLLTENPDTVMVKESSPRPRVAEQIFPSKSVTCSGSFPLSSPGKNLLKPLLALQG